VKKLKIFIFYLILTNPIQATVKDDIILNLKKTNNIRFYFKQTIDQKTEK